jgi:hypothetical protein
VQLAVLLGLAALWVAVLLPDFLKRRGTRRAGDSISNFNRHLSVLERSNPMQGSGRRSSTIAPSLATIARPRRAAAPVDRSNVVAMAPRRRAAATVAPSRPGVGMTTSQAQRRRQDVIVGLGAASLLSFLAALSFGGVMLGVHLVIDVLLVAYLVLALRISQRQRARSAVTYLPAPSPVRRATVPQRSSMAR